MSSSTIPSNLDKLAQLDPALNVKQLDSTLIMKKRARSKWWTQQFNAPLIALDSPLKNYYQNAYNCGHYVQVKDGKAKSSYCNTRTCNVCNRIRTAKAMNGYISQLQGLNWLMLTLTDVNCSGEDLKKEMALYKKDFVLIRRKLKKLGYKVDGIVKIETTYNETNDTYHPHIHAVVAHEQIDFLAVEIINDWLQRRPSASIKAQNITRDHSGALNELFKYTTKGFQREGKNISVNPQSIDIIMTAQYGQRSFQPFGSIRKVNEEVPEIIEAQPMKVPDGIFSWYDCDWWNIRTGEALSYYVPDRDIKITYARVRPPTDN